MTSESILNEIEKLDIAERILLTEAAWDSICLPDAEVHDEKLRTCRKQRERCSPADKFAELRRLCLEENYALELPDRCNRHNIFAGTRNELSL